MVLNCHRKGGLQMSMPKAGVSLVVENDQQFKAALSEVNAGLKVNKQQMQLVTEQTREMDDRQAALKQRYESVQQTLQSYRDKVEILQQAYENSAKREGEGSKVTMQWKASLISAQTEVAKQENLLKELGDQQERTNKTTASLADVINGLANTLGISLPPGVQAAVDKLGQFSASGAAAVTVVGGLVGALAKSTIDMSKTADDLLTLSTQTSLTTDQLQEFEYASELVDVSTDTLRSSLVKLTNNMQTAATGTGSAAEAFKKLHVKVSDSSGKLKDNYEVFLKTIDALGKVKNETERDALAMDIFGRSATDLNPLIEAGSGRLKELAEQAHEVGYVVDNETLQSFGELDDAMQKLDKQGDAVKRSFAEALLPIITAFAEALSAIPTPVLTAVISITSIATVVLLVAKAIKDLQGPVGTVKSMIGSAMSHMDLLYIKILAIVAAITALVAVIAVLIGKGNEINSAMSGISSATTGTMRAANSKVPQYATGTRSARGGMALVGENGPELVNLRGGEHIYTNGQTRSLLGGDSISIGQITIDAKNVKEFNDIVNIARNEAVSMRQGVTT
nr:MAG TPA: tail tape measure [Caudoviricetes sp.]